MSTGDLWRASSPNYQTWIATLPFAYSHLVTTSSPMLQPAMRIKIFVWSWVHWRQWLRLRLRVASLCEEIVTSVNASYNSDDTRVSTSCRLTELTTSSPMLQLAERVEIVVSSRLYQCRWLLMLVACLCSETDPPTADLTTFWQRCWQRCWPPSAVPCCSSDGQVRGVIQSPPMPVVTSIATDGLPIRGNAPTSCRSDDIEAALTGWQRWWQPPAVPRCSQKWEPRSLCDPVSTHVCDHGWLDSAGKRIHH